jgi:hypothetical protein
MGRPVRDLLAKASVTDATGALDGTLTLSGRVDGKRVSARAERSSRLPALSATSPSARREAGSTVARPVRSATFSPRRA